MTGLPSRSQIRSGSHVSVETKKNQGTGRLTDGTVDEILTSGESHPHGIKVRLKDGQVGRVKHVAAGGAHTNHTPNSNPIEYEIRCRPGTNDLRSGTRFEDLNSRPIPKTEDGENEFKEFYQYDPKMDGLLADRTRNKDAINGMKHSARERIAKAVCSFGNSHTGGFLYIGVKGNGTVSGLDKDMDFGEFSGHTDSFANHLRDILEDLLNDRVFITNRIRMAFPKIDGKTICIIQILPAVRPLYLKTREKSFFVRGSIPRAEKLDAEDQFKYIKERFPNYG